MDRRSVVRSTALRWMRRRPTARQRFSYAHRDVATVTPDTPLADAVKLLERSREPRLVVLDKDGHALRGLLCFNRSSESFCVH